MNDGKTNVMRLLEQAGIAYLPHTYPHGKEAVDGVTVARLTGRDPDAVFKTLVARGHSGGFCVFVIPVGAELDLKKAARAAGEKAVELIPVKELLPLTGYVRGGCSPVGMKKRFPTFLEEAALLQASILVSAGRIGSQVEVGPEALAEACGAVFSDLIL